ncbi:MAG: metallophosphoesterase [Clostridia bacterium]|nr:metallophosphoesterase [Clostridia bacterium]
MKKFNKLFAVILAFLLLFGCIPYAAAADKKLTVNEDGSFRILQISDIQQSSSKIHERTFSTIKLSIAKYKPNLIVMTGDNISGANTTEYFDDAVKKITSLFVDQSGNKIPFAVTYGNHDYEQNTLDNTHSIEKQNSIYLKYGAIDFDDKSISDTGTGYIDVYSRDGSQVAERIIIINSGTYAKDGYFGKAGYNQVTVEDKKLGDNEERYNQIVAAVDSWTDAGYPTVAFEHIPLREMYIGDSPAQQILVKNSKGKSCPRFVEDGQTYKWSISKENPTITGSWETACACSGVDTFALFKALAKDNVSGIYYGHDHLNTLTGTTTITRNNVSYTLRQGYGGGMLVYAGTYPSYIGNKSNNPLASVYTLNDGKITKDTFGYNDVIKSINNISYGGTYVSDVRLFTGNTFEEACNNAVENRFIPIKKSINKGTNANLNLNSSGKAIALGYRKTTDESRALTDIRVLRMKKTEPELNIPDVVPTTYVQQTADNQSVLYTVENSDNPTDMNLGIIKNQTEHTSLYLYKTSDPNAGMPIKSLFETEASTNAVYYNSSMLPYSRVTYFGNEGYADLLDGTGIQTYIFVYMTYGEYIEKCTGHYDMNGDGYCDICFDVVSGIVSPNTQNCDCRCHKSGVMGFIYKIQRFFWKLFGINKVCKCGATHY